MTLDELKNVPVPEIRKITERISYIPASEGPLSADTVIIRGDSATWFYDVGCTFANLQYLYTLPGEKSVIVSHFHADHTWWLTPHTQDDPDIFFKDDYVSANYTRPDFKTIYGGAATASHVPGTTVVDSPLVIEDGVTLRIIPLPATHCKGSLMLVVDDTYAFLGDATYTMQKGGRAVYNSQLLKEELDILKATTAPNFCLSHDRCFIRPARVVIRQLEAVYSRRSKNDPYIEV